MNDLLAMFVTVFLAEFGDKTQLATVLFASERKMSPLLVFVASGLIHDLVISVPARGGYGLPTVYFILQGLGVMLERSTLGRRLGVQKGIAAWLFLLVVAAVPAFWLFHPPFVRRVILPFMQAVHAL